MRAHRTYLYTKFSTNIHLKKSFRYPIPLTGTLDCPIIYHMYIEQLDTFYVEIPKTGASSVNAALGPLYSPWSIGGHKRVIECLEVLGRTPKRIVCCIRDPMDRLVSAVNHFCNDSNDLTYWLRLLSDREVTRGDGAVPFFMFKPQRYYLSAADFGVDFNVEVYPFEDFADLLASFGFEGKLPRKNVSKNKFSRDEVLNNDYCEGAFMKNYFMDQVSYTRLLNGDRVLSGENAKV